MKIFLCVAALIAAVSAGGYGSYESHHGGAVVFDSRLNKFAKIVRLVGSSDNAGNYNFESEGTDGTKMAEAGGLKMVKGELGATKVGTASWTAPDGQRISMSYKADEEGYKVEGSHLPTPPPMPEEIKKSLLLLPKLDLSQYEKPTITFDSTYTPYAYAAKPTKVFVATAPLVVAPPAPITFLAPEAPTKTLVETPEYVIDSDNTRTFFKIGH